MNNIYKAGLNIVKCTKRKVIAVKVCDSWRLFLCQDVTLPNINTSYLNLSNCCDITDKIDRFMVDSFNDEYVETTTRSCDVVSLMLDKTPYVFIGDCKAGVGFI